MQFNMKLPQIIIFASLGIVFMSVVMKLWLFDAIVRFVIRDQTSLRKRNEVRRLYLKIPFPLNFKVYFFNVSNPMEIQNGQKPIVQEVGPYWYDEFKEKIDVVDNDMEDSLTYTPHDILKFNQNKSGSLTEDDYVTILHPLIVSMVNQVMEDAPILISMVKQSLPHLFNDPKSIFLTTKVKDILFDGVEVNCTSKDFATSAICSQMKSKVAGIKLKGGHGKIYLISLLGARNGTQATRIKILRGIDESKDLGKVVAYDGKKKLTLWSTMECNRFEGTDGWIFPPLLTPEEGIKAFAGDICRNVKVNYMHDTTYKGLKVRIYETDLGDQSTNEADKCYCRTPSTCLKKGIIDLGKCVGAPILATLPHFLHTDESYLSEIQGLEPDVDKHGLRIVFEPMTGCPLRAAKRMQFNFDIQANKKVVLFKNLSTALFPLLWLEEGAELDGYLLKRLQMAFLLIKISHVILYVTIISGIISLCVAIFYHYKNTKEISSTPVYDIKKKNEDNSVEASDMQNFARNRGSRGMMGHTNPVISGHDKNKKEVSISPVNEIEKNEENSVEASDMQNLTRNRASRRKIGYTNSVMSGHEFDRY